MESQFSQATSSQASFDQETPYRDTSQEASQATSQATSQAESPPKTGVTASTQRELYRYGLIHQAPLSRKRRTSSIWDWGFHVYRIDAPRTPLWACKVCWRWAVSIDQLAIYKALSTSNSRRHLKAAHGLVEGPLGRLISPGDRIENPTGRHEGPLDPEIELVRWVVMDTISFRQASSVAHNDLMAAINGGKPTLSLRNHSSISTRIDDVFKECRLLVSQRISQSISKVSLSYDIWTSTNKLPFIGLLCHYISDEDTIRQRSVLLALQEIRGLHTGVNIGSVLHQAIQDYGITHRIGYLMSDNAENNTASVKELGRLLGIPLVEKRLRCIAHIINLICQELVKVCPRIDPEIVTENTDTMQNGRLDTFEDNPHGQPAELDLGCITRLSAIIAYIEKSAQRMQEFQNIQEEILASGHADLEQKQPLRLIRENTTRWNARYDSIKRSFLLRRSIERYCDQETDLTVDAPTEVEWKVLATILKILEPMKTTTMSVQGDPVDGEKGGLFQSYLAICLIIQKLGQATKDITESNVLRILLNPLARAQAKAIKYRAKIEETDVYRLALILHPRYKSRLLRCIDTSSPSVDDVIQDLRTEVSKRRAMDSVAQNAEFAKGNQTDNTFRELLDTYGPHVSPPDTTAVDEVSCYLADSLISTETPLGWWHNNRIRYPALYSIALDLFATPASAAGIERIWSICGRIFDDERSRMKPSTTEKLACLRDWFANEIISRKDLEDMMDKRRRS